MLLRLTILEPYQSSGMRAFIQLSRSMAALQITALKMLPAFLRRKIVNARTLKAQNVLVKDLHV